VYAGIVGVCAQLIWHAEPAAANQILCNVHGGLSHCVVGFQHAGFDQAVAQQQANSEWCWAATLSMILNYEGLHVSQKAIVLHRWGSLANMPSGALKDFTDHISGLWTDAGPQFTLNIVEIDPTDVDQIASALHENYPLMLMTTHHAMVLTGLGFTVDNAANVLVDTETGVPAVTVFDPWPPNYQGAPGGRRVLSNDEWQNVVKIFAIKVS
jgi:hypothetical protein